MMRRRLALWILLASVPGLAVPAAAEDTVSARLCLFVEVPVGVTSVDAESATAMIGSGEMSITDVVPCEGSVQPPTRSPRTESTELPGSVIGSWFASEVLSGREDGTVAIAGMNAVEGVSSTGAPVTLAIRCRADGVDALVTWEDPLEVERPGVTFAYGSGRTVSFDARRSADRTGTFYPADEVDDLLAALATESVLEVTLDLEQAPSLRAVFDVSGAEEALVTVREACTGTS